MADGTNEGITPNEELAEQIGPEGTLASIHANLPKIRAGSATEGQVDEKPVKEKPQETEKPKEEGAAPEGDAAGDGAEPKGTEEFKPKYKTHEEAEKAALEATRKMTMATTQAAKDKEAREAVEAERNELKQKLEEALAKPPEKPAEETKPPTGADRKAAIKAVTKTVFAKIAEMNRSDDDYQEQVADAWAEGLEAVGMGGANMTQAEIDKMVKDSLKESLKAEKEAAKEAEAATKAEQSKADQEAENVRIWQQATDYAKKAGLNMTPGSADDRLFRDIANNDLAKQDFMKGETPPPLEDQFKWIVGEVRKLAGQVVETSEAEKERARKAQIENGVLTRGNNRPAVKEAATQDYSVASLRKAEREGRAARHKGA